LVNLSREYPDSTGGAGSITAGKGKVSALMLGSVENVAIFRHLDGIESILLAIANPDSISTGHGAKISV
jgi:hypothetical protein